MEELTQHEKNLLEHSIYDWISSLKYHLPSFTILDCAKSYLGFCNKKCNLNINEVVEIYNKNKKSLIK